MNETENQIDDVKKGLGVKDWVMIGIGVVAFLVLLGFFKGNASNVRLAAENKRLASDVRFISVLATTLVEVKQKEIEVNKWDYNEKLNQGYLNFYKKLNIKSESTTYFKSKLEEAMIEKANFIEQRNEKATSYNEYSKSFDWEKYKSDLYNLPEEIRKIE
jgi:hypothetical protein